MNFCMSSSSSKFSWMGLYLMFQNFIYTPKFGSVAPHRFTFLCLIVGEGCCNSRGDWWNLPESIRVAFLRPNPNGVVLMSLLLTFIHISAFWPRKCRLGKRHKSLEHGFLEHLPNKIYDAKKGGLEWAFS